MSILATATAPPPSPVVLGACLLFAAGVVVVAYFTRVMRPAALSLPDRIPPAKPAGLLVIVTIAGAAIWFGSQVGYMILRVAQAAAAQGGKLTGGFDESMLTATDFAILATVPAAAGMVALVVGDVLLGRPRLIAALGYDRRKFLRGLVLGLLAMAFTIPLMLSLSVALETAYQLIGYEHPKEHILLKALGEATNPLVKWMIVAGAALGAPLFEELLFRAHLQTLLRRFGLILTGRGPVAIPSGGFPAVLPDQPAAGAAAGPGPHWIPQPNPPSPYPPSPYPPSSAPLPPPGDSAIAPPPHAPVGPLPLSYGSLGNPHPPAPRLPAWPSWMAIVVTSLLFAVVHPLWTAPLIFVLSLCLGYAYERTNNLWVPITMHALFNGLQTALFLSGMADS